MTDKPASEMSSPESAPKLNTATRMAFVRALDSNLPPEERVCYDPMAIHLVADNMKPLATTPQGREAFYGQMTPMMMTIVWYICLRTRVIDECLMSVLEQGLEQFVLLGGGYDARPFRFEGLKNPVKNFDVDLPELQAEKIPMLEKALGSIPDNVKFVPVDFETQDLESALGDAGYDPGKKTFFVWEGVTFYLDPDAIDQTLGFVAANSGPGSSIIFDYTSPEVADGSYDHPMIKEMLGLAASLGEPYKFGTDPASIGRFLSDRGLDLIENLSVEECMKKYHGPAQADRPVAPFYNIAHARVVG